MKTLNKTVRLHRALICICTYLIVCFIFGVIYCYIANDTKGQAFVFQEDILLQSKNKEFQKEMKIRINDNVTKELFINYNKDFILMKMNRYDSSFISFNLTSSGLVPIGSAWANYYIAKWKSQGFNYYSARIIEKDQLIFGNTDYTKILFYIYSIPVKAVHQEFRDTTGKYPPHLTDTVPIEKVQDFYIWINETEFRYLRDYLSYNGKPKKIISLDYSKYILSNAVNYLDNAIDIIYKYETQSHFKYSFVDFLYFSAVTITSLGYGDILPNSTLVRGLVMTETIMGTIIMAISISFLYDRVKNIK